MIRLEDILPGDVIINKTGIEGIVCSLHDLKPKSLAHDLCLSHLLGGQCIWCFWSDDTENRPLYTKYESVVEHRPQGKQYDPTQQPYDEDDI